MFWNKSSKAIEVLEHKLLIAEAELSFLNAKNDVSLGELFILPSDTNIDAFQRHSKFLQRLSNLAFPTDWTLEQELTNLKQYIELYAAVSPKDLHYKINLSIDNAKIKIPALILFPLVQNAVVNGYNTMDKFPMRVKLKINRMQIYFEVSNRVNHRLINQADSKLIREFEKRLKFHFAERFNLIVNSNSNLFKVTLIVRLNEHELSI